MTPLVCLEQNAEVTGKCREKSNWDKILREHFSPKLGTGRIPTDSECGCVLARAAQC